MKFISHRIITTLAVALGLAFPLHAAEKADPKARSATEAKASAAKVDLNTATLAELETLPGVGTQTARAIVAARPFATVSELENVSGIGPAKMDDLRSRVTVSRQTAAKKDAKPSSSKSTASARDAAKSSSATERSASTKATDRQTRSAKIDVNTADAATLETLPGVGPATAKEIIASRPFTSVDDLERVSGIGAARLEALRDHVTISRRSAAVTTGDAKTKRPSSVETPSSTPSRRSTGPAEARTPPIASGAPRTTDERELEPTGRPSTPRGVTAATASARVNLNTATLQELEALPEIGPVKAQAIIDARPFTSVEDVMRVKGIKEATFDAIKDQITVR